jgi:hypothetical protein
MISKIYYIYYKNTKYIYYFVAFVFGVKAPPFAVPVRQAHEIALSVLTVMRQRYRYPGRVRDIARRAFISYLFILYGE